MVGGWVGYCVGQGVGSCQITKISINCNLIEFFKFLLDTCLFVGPLIPLFWTSGDVSSWFQSQSGFCLIHTWQRHT